MKQKYQVFARKYRPKTFDEILGQDHVVQTLKNAISQNRLAHTYLFVGPRGTGKTSTARIFAKALNCKDGPKIDFDPNDDISQEISEGRNLDVMEIDGASNNSVDQIRDLRESVKFSPNQGQFRIYYIDEVHMLSTAAFNALLKTLEEPPAHVKFIFATTEAHKILSTILSRCQRFDLKRITPEIISQHLLKICKLEKVEINEEATLAIAKASEGSMRDAQSMLDQLVSFCGDKIKTNQIYEIFGTTPIDTILNLAESIVKSKTRDALDIINDQNENGKNLSIFLSELMECFRSILIIINAPDYNFKSKGKSEIEKIGALAKEISQDKLIRILDILIDSNSKLKWANNKLIILETTVIKAIQSLNYASINQVIDTISTSLATTQNEIIQNLAPSKTLIKKPKENLIDEAKKIFDAEVEN